MSGLESQDYKISLPTAILINTNIMLGAGIFINTQPLAEKAGLLGAFMYILIGVLMLPLILSIAKLLQIHPSGGFYTFAKKEIHPFMGFLSCWSYFTAKIASCMLMIHVSMTLIQHIFPFLIGIPTYLLDIGAVLLFTGLNLLNIKAGSAIQTLFMGFKAFPIIFGLLAGAFLLQGDPFSYANVKWEGLETSLPLVIYAVIGFEAACSMSSKIKNASKNAPIAVVASFSSVILLAALYQMIFYGALGETLASCKSHCDTFPAMISRFFGETLFAHKFEGLLHLAIASSTLGAAYGILFSNCWNLHILAENRHIPFSSVFKKFNKNQIPYLCVAVEGILCLIYLLVSQGALIPMQQIGALGCVMAYTLSVGSLMQAVRKNPALQKPTRLLPGLGLISCTLLLGACVRSFFINGMSSLITYSCLLGFGLIMYIMTSEKSISSENIKELT